MAAPPQKARPSRPPLCFSTSQPVSRGTQPRLVAIPGDRARTRQNWSTAVATGSSYPIEYRVHRHDGEYRTMLTRGVSILAEDDGSRSFSINTKRACRGGRRAVEPCNATCRRGQVQRLLGYADLIVEAMAGGPAERFAADEGPSTWGTRSRAPKTSGVAKDLTFKVRKEEKDRLLIDSRRQQGWISKSDAIPFDQAVAHFPKELDSN